MKDEHSVNAASYLLSREMDISPGHFTPDVSILFFAYQDIPPLMYDERVRGLPPRV